MSARAPALVLLAALALLGFLLGVAAPAAEAARPPVVMFVFDEFPADAIMRPDGRIDAQRFPGFAALARVSTWFPNATTVYDSTDKAAPAIEVGLLPQERLEASYRDHPRSIFTTLDRAGYRMNVLEEATTVCPPSICPRVSNYGNPTYHILHRRRERLQRTIRSIKRSRQPVFTYHHTMLPHVPWIYLQTGQRARGVPEGVLPDFKSPAGFHHPFLTQHNEQRFLLQVGFVDREIRRLLRQLRRQRLLRRAMIVATADHGMSFQTNVSDRRAVTETNVHEIAPVPLFIKRPGQRSGRVDRSYAATVDIVPSIADALGLRVDHRVDGRSVYGPEVRQRPGIAMITRDFRHRIVVAADDLEQRRRLNRDRRARLLGTGPWSRAFRIGPDEQLHGERVSSLPSSTTRARARFLVPTQLEHIDPRAVSVPTFASGRIRGARGKERELALAVNGTIRATATSFHLRGDATEWFGIELPLSALRRGSNAFTLYEVRTSLSGDRSLARLGAVG